MALSVRDLHHKSALTANMYRAIKSCTYLAGFSLSDMQLEFIFSCTFIAARGNAKYSSQMSHCLIAILLT